MSRKHDTHRSVNALMEDLERTAHGIAEKTVEPAATDAWIAEMYPSIHRAAWAITGNPTAADDLAQETFVVAIEQWERFSGRSKRSTWLHGILIRLSRKHFRASARLQRRLQNWGRRRRTETEASDPARQLAEVEWRQSIWSEIAKLPRPQAEAITLRFHSEWSYEQIAESLGCAVGTAKTRVHQGLKRLRQSNALHDEPLDVTNAPEITAPGKIQ